MIMKRCIYFILFSLTIGYSQINEIGLFLGGSNVIGDVGPTTYVNPNKPVFGILYKWNKSSRHSYRVYANYSVLEAKDSKSDLPNRQQRDFSFKNNVFEFGLGLEYDFFEFDLHNLSKPYTPYVMIGVNFVGYDEIYYLDSKESTFKYEHYSFSIPIVLGLKYRISNSLVVGLESGVRYALNDNLDGSDPRSKDFEGLRFGNLQSNDWYVFSGITLTYTFGENPCFCNY